MREDRTASRYAVTVTAGSGRSGTGSSLTVERSASLVGGGAGEVSPSFEMVMSCLSSSLAVIHVVHTIIGMRRVLIEGDVFHFTHLLRPGFSSLRVSCTTMSSPKKV